MSFEIIFVLIKYLQYFIFSYVFEIFRPFIKKSYEFESSQYTDLEVNPQNYYPHLPTCLMIDIRDGNGPQGKGLIWKDLILFFQSKLGYYPLIRNNSSWLCFKFSALWDRSS